jgi:hypothetical protein
MATTDAFGAGKRTPWGDPDFQGTYTTDNSIGVPLERPTQFGTRATLTDERVRRARVGQRCPSREGSESPARERVRRGLGGERLVAARRADRRCGLPASYADFSSYDTCISRGVAGSVLPAIYGNGTKIMQAPGYVVVQNEMIHESRVIPLDGRAHVGGGVREWMGDSRGHFERDTLVIETTNLNQRTGVGGFGNGAVQSAEAKLIERLTRADASTVRYELT